VWRAVDDTVDGATMGWDDERRACEGGGGRRPGLTLFFSRGVSAYTVEKFETVDKKAKKKASNGGANDSGANGARKFEKRYDGKGPFNNRENGATRKNGKYAGSGMPAPRGGERGDRRQDRGKTAAAPTPAMASSAPAVVAAPAAKLEPVPNPAPIRPGGKTLADLVRGEPAAAAAPTRPQGGAAAKGGVPRPQGAAGKPMPKVNGANAGVPAPNFNGAAATNEPVNWAKKVSGAQAPVAQAPVAQQQQRPPQPTQQHPQQARQAAPQPTSTDSFGFGFDASTQASAVPRPQQAMEQQAQDLGLQFGNFSSAGGDFGFGFDSSSQQSAAGWGVQQQQQQRQPAAQAKRQPTSRNSGVASKLPDANSLNGSATTSGPDGQPVMPAYFGGMMPNAYANYMMPPAVPMAGGYAGYEGYQASAQTTTAQEGAYAEYYKQQAAAQNAQAQAATGGVSGDKTASGASAQQMQAYANMPNAYGHPMYSYPYAMPHQPAYPYAVQSHYPYPPGAGVYPGAASSKQSAGNVPPGYKAQDAAAQQYAQGGQNVGGRDSQAAQYAEMQQGYYTQYASQYAANGYRQ
jgi:hypothetical protein